MISQITALIDRFVNKEDITISSANQIELALDDAFPEDDYIQHTVEILALYRPGGGAYLFDAAAVASRLDSTKGYLLNLARPSANIAD